MYDTCAHGCSRGFNFSDGVDMIDDKISKVLKYGVSYADSSPVSAPVGFPSSFFDKAYFSQLQSMTPWLWASEPSWHERNWQELLARDPAQLPDADSREGYFGSDHLGYWLSGFVDYAKTVAAAQSLGLEGGRYFDFGGSTGRVFRHFAFQTDRWDVWTSDFKPSSVEWNLLHYPTIIKAFLNSCQPSLPLPDSYFDLVTAFSVFTHINETETSWLLEIRRILKVGGIAYISIHNEDYWPFRSQWRDLSPFRPDLAGLEEMPKGKTVVTWREDDPYNCDVFHSRDYIERVWGRYFEICEFRARYHFNHGVVICRRLN